MLKSKDKVWVLFTKWFFSIIRRDFKVIVFCLALENQKLVIGNYLKTTKPRKISEWTPKYF